MLSRCLHRNVRGQSAYQCNCEVRMSTTDYYGWVDRRKRHLWTQIVNQRSWWVGGSVEETSVDIVSIKDHNGWVNQRKRHLWILQLQAEFVKICFGFSTRFPLLLNKTVQNQAEIWKIIVAVIIQCASWTRAKLPDDKLHLCQIF